MGLGKSWSQQHEKESVVRRIILTIADVAFALASTLVFILWMLFRDRSFALAALWTLNDRGPLRFEALLRNMGYAGAREIQDDERVGIKLRLQVSALLSAVEDGLLSVVYDEGHQECPHATFHITVKGQSMLAKGRRYG